MDDTEFDTIVNVIKKMLGSEHVQIIRSGEDLDLLTAEIELQIYLESGKMLH